MGDTFSAEEQCKDVCKAALHLPHSQTFSSSPPLTLHSALIPITPRKSPKEGIMISKYLKMLRDVSTHHLC